MADFRNMLLACATLMVAGFGSASSASAADQILYGAIASPAGQKADGVTVSAKREGSTITTSVYTDATGNYYFPPMPAGKYRVWAQALGFEQSKALVDLSANKRQDLSLKTITDPEAKWRQLPGELVMASLPEDNADDVIAKQILHNQCNGCHTPSYPLQFRFDEQGWTRIIDLMKAIGGAGNRVPDRPAMSVIQLNEKRLAVYLAKVRGPNSVMKISERPRPSGEAAHAVWMLYDVPRVDAVGAKSLPAAVNADDNLDGTNWARGTPSRIGIVIHDDASDFEGNLWFTANQTNYAVTVGRVDAKTGEVTYKKVPRANGSGLAATAHGITRDGQGNLWFNVNPGRNSLGKIEPATGKLTVYPTPEGMQPLGGAVTLDVDGKGMVWASAPAGVLRFNPKTLEFTEYKTTQVKRPYGTGGTYGAAGDRNGNGWWAEMGFDTIGKADGATGKVTEIVLPENRRIKDFLTQQEMAAYGKVTDISTGNPYPWAQGPRRMGTDKNGDVLWVGDSWGSTLARIDTNTNAVKMIPFPTPAMQPYHIAVDSKHNVWGDLWTNDQIFKYDPAADKWTTFELPVRGTELRHISVDEHGGVLKITMPVYRVNAMGVMTIRSDADIAQLKQQVATK
jgi:virginiamycin B lyase